MAGTLSNPRLTRRSSPILWGQAFVLNALSRLQANLEAHGLPLRIWLGMNYLPVKSRADVALAISMVPCYVSNPSREYVQALERRSLTASIASSSRVYTL